MPEAVAAAFATPAFWGFSIVFMLAGLVRGFTGFGTALIVVPFSWRYLPAEGVITLITLSELLPSFYLLPKALRDADRGESAILCLGGVCAVPLGLWLLVQIDPTPLRWGVAVIALVTLLSILIGWHIAPITRRLWIGAIGLTGGVIGGATGLTGPAVILGYLAQRRPARSIRATIILYLVALDWALLLCLLIFDRLEARYVLFSVMMSLPYLATIYIGQNLFREGRERSYKNAAIAVIALSILLGLPLWDDVMGKF